MLMLKNRGGFTLFEVMITMAVSAAMLVMTVILFNGQQRKTQFAQSVRDLQETLQDIQNDTATGYFPNSTYVCSATPTGPQISAGSGVQGTNQDCIFLGKAIHFKKNSMEIYPIVGNRKDASLATATFQTSLPATIPQLKETKRYQYDLELYEIWWNNNVTSHISDGRLIVFASTPNGTGTAASGDFFNSGTQKINSYTSSPTNAIDETSSPTDIDAVMRNGAFGWSPSTSTVTLCFQDGGLSDPNRQRAGIIISGGIQGISVSRQSDTDAVVCS